MFYAQGNGELKLDSLHEQPMIITPVEYAKIRLILHPYVQELLDLTMKIIGK